MRNGNLKICRCHFILNTGYTYILKQETPYVEIRRVGTLQVKICRKALINIKLLDGFHHLQVVAF